MVNFSQSSLIIISKVNWVGHFKGLYISFVIVVVEKI